MIVLVGNGQSNMESSNAGLGGDRSTESGVWCWEQFPRDGQTKGWKETGPDDFHFPWNNGQEWPNGGALYARARYLRQTTGQPVYIIRQALGGHPISSFNPGGANWASFMVSVRDAAASAQLSGRSVLADEYHFHQGEANADYRGSTGAEYLAGLDTHFAQMRKPQAAYGNVRVCGPTTPIFLYELAVGGMASGGPTDDRNAEIALFADARDPYVINVPSDGLTAVADTIHFDAASLEEMGGVRCIARKALLPKTCKYVDLPGGLVWIEGGYVTLTAGAPKTVIPLPVSLNTNYVPVITPTRSAAPAPSSPLVIDRTATSFALQNVGANNIICGWTITGRRA